MGPKADNSLSFFISREVSLDKSKFALNSYPHVRQIFIVLKVLQTKPKFSLPSILPGPTALSRFN